MIASPYPAYGPERDQRVLGGFWARAIEPTPLPLTYTLAAAATAVAMVLLPLVYGALVVSVGALLVVYFLRYSQTGSLGLVGPAIDVAVGGVGLLLITFLLKPFFARRHRPFAPRPVRRDQEPLLFIFLERLCAAVGAPFPKRVYLDCRPNASAGLRRGFLSFFSDDLVLVLGLPLVAGLSVQQLGGVIAHELGHFSQGMGMRLSYAVRSIDQWFARLVLERDAWDLWLERQASNSDLGPVTWVFVLSRLAVRATRGVLWLFMMGSHALSCALLRQMELDADRYEVRLVGAQTFESTCWQMALLQVAFDRAMEDLGESLRDGRLADDFAGLVVANGREMPAVIRDQLRAMMAMEKTTWFATHPAMRRRVEEARSETGRPIFSCELNAAVLFRDFAALAQRVSLDFYRASLGSGVRPGRLYPLGEIVERRDRSASDRDALDRFFRGTLSPLWPFVLDSRSRSAGGDEALVAQARSARDACQEAVRRLRQATDRHRDLVGHGIAQRQMQALQAAGYQVEVPWVDEHELMEVENQLATDMALFAHRMMSAFFLMKSPNLSLEVTGISGYRREAPELMRSLVRLNDVHPMIRELHAQRGELDILVAQLQRLRQGGQGDGTRSTWPVRNALQVLHAQLRELEERLRNAPYPFDHADADHTLAKDLIPELPEQDDLALHGVCERVLRCYYDLYHRVVGRLAFVAEQLERGAGIEPLAVLGPR